MNDERKKILPGKPGSGELNAFLSKVAATPVRKQGSEQGRLIFAMDATASRAPLWDRACQVQAEMFKEVESIGGLSIQLVYYRGYGEFSASPWFDRAETLLRQMTGVQCLAGTTQIEKVFQQALAETRQRKVHAVVFVGDCVEEDPHRLEELAGQLGLLGVPAFIFQEGDDPLAERAFRTLTKLTGGAYCRFNPSSAQQLRDLLCAVAVYAAGGRKALETHHSGDTALARELMRQLPAPRR